MNRDRDPEREAECLHRHRAGVNIRMRDYTAAVTAAEMRAPRDAVVAALERVLRDGQRAFPDVLGAMDARKAAEVLASNWSAVAL